MEYSQGNTNVSNRSVLNTETESTKVELSSDDWVMYECIKAAALNTSIASSTGTTLKDFFSNVHSKVTQNMADKHILAQKSTELRQAL